MGRPYIRRIDIQSFPAFYGNILCYDDFESTLKFDSSGTGADYIGDLSESYTYFGSKSLKMKTRATDPAEDDYVSCCRTISPRDCFTISVKFLALFPVVTSPKHFAVYFYFDDFVHYYTAAIRYEISDKKLHFLNSLSEWQAIDNIFIELSYPQWLFFELGFNLLTGKYISAQMAGLKADLSNENLNDIGTSDVYDSRIELRLTSNNNLKPEVYVDNFLIEIKE
jgi:hypothetical protein